MKSIFRLISFLLCIPIPAMVMAQPPLNIYYLAIGSAHYRHDLRSLNDLDDVPPAINSAQLFAGLLDSCGPLSGTTLLSGDDHLITADEMIDSTASLLNRAVKDWSKYRKPATIVIYYCGHGLKADSGRQLFLVPGNFVCPAVTNYEELSLSALSINKLLRKSITRIDSSLMQQIAGQEKALDKDLTFCLLFDCCYNTKKTQVGYIDSLESFMWIDQLNQPSQPDQLNQPDSNGRDSAHVLTNLGVGIDVTDIAKGMADFLVKRSKQELESAFFKKLIIDDSFANYYNTNIFYAASPGAYAQMTYLPAKATESIVAGPLCAQIAKFDRNKSAFTYKEFLYSLKDYNAYKSKKTSNGRKIEKAWMKQAPHP